VLSRAKAFGIDLRSIRSLLELFFAPIAVVTAIYSVG